MTIRNIKASELQPDLSNANRGTERGRALLEQSLRTYGAGRSILVDKHGRIIAGNKTLETAAEIGLDDVVVVQTDGRQVVAVQRMDLDLAQDEEARMLAYADNRVGQIDLDFDPAQLLADINAGFPLDQFWQQDELDVLMAELMPPATTGDTPPQIDKAAELQAKWQTQTGQLWALGEHRLIVGDCTDKATVERVMGGEPADAVVTDPPYGIGVDRAMHEKGGQQYGKAAAPKRHYAESDWDGNPPSKEAIDYIVSLAAESVLWGGNYFELPPARCYLVWDKQNDGNQFADCELAWTNLDKPVRLIRHMWNGMLRADKEERNSHPTQKPLAVMVWAIEQLNAECKVILDPFAGSGTTGIACHNLGRKARMIEIAPNYAAVILQRMADHTGQTPRLVI